MDRARHRRAVHLAARRGLTLIELTVSIAIVGILLSAAVIGVGALTGTRARSMAGELSGTIRSLYDKASLSGQTCRLVFQLPKTDKESGFRYWAECGSGEITARMDRDNALRDETRAADDAEKLASRGKKLAMSTSTYEDLVNAEKQRIENATRFSNFTSEVVKAKEVSGVSVTVWTRHQQQPVHTGLAYLYFFPQGYTERAQVYLRQGSNVWTITVAPLTGKTAVVSEELEVPKS